MSSESRKVGGAEVEKETGRLLSTFHDCRSFSLKVGIGVVVCSKYKRT